MGRIFGQIRSRRITSHFLFTIIALSLVFLLVMLYDLLFASRAEEAILQDYEEKLQSSIDSVVIPKMISSLDVHFVEGNLDTGLPEEEKTELLHNAFNDIVSFLVPSHPGTRFGLYIPENKKIFVQGYLRQYRDLVPEERKSREDRVLDEAKNGLMAVAASGEPLTRLTRSLNDEIYEYLVPVTYKGELVAVVWADNRLNPILAQNRNFLAFIKYTAIFGLFFGILGTLSIIRNLTASVDKIKNGLQGMRADIHQRIPEMGGEIGEIAMAINQMASSLEEKGRLEKELRRSERLAALGRLVTGVAHELRNPIGIVKTTTQLMEHELRDDVPDVIEFSRIIREQVDRQNRIIKELLDFGRPTKPVVENVSLNSILEKVLTFAEAMLRQQKIVLTLSLAHNLPVIRVDGEQIKQVFVNLILNATQAMPGGGELTITSFYDQQNIIVEFKDTGPGISEEDRKNIFDPFYTTKEAGTGLGLSISHQIVTLNCGVIDVYNEQTGTVFAVKFPLSEGAGGEL